MHISDPQHSAAGTAANQETANMANDSPLDDSDADYSDALQQQRQRSPVADQRLSTDRICNDSFSDLVHTVHSADNPRAAVATTHRFTNEHYDKCSTRGDGDGGACVSSEAEARIPSIQFVNYSTVQ
jgi:hypothetical protein